MELETKTMEIKNAEDVALQLQLGDYGKEVRRLN